MLWLKAASSSHYPCHSVQQLDSLTLLRLLPAEATIPWCFRRFSCAATKAENSSGTRPQQCTIKPSYKVALLHTGGQQTIMGGGTLYAYAGRHLFPSRIGEAPRHVFWSRK
jgi:hypothetical protein